MGVITNVSDYSNRCLELEKNDDIVRPDFNAHEMNYEVEMYSPDGEFLGSTKDDLVFIDWKARIARKGVHGYYIKVNGICYILILFYDNLYIAAMKSFN